ncbi:cell division protein FtsZ [Candidatus Acetothermia bacterium]|nr:cell division protein FtsZ [Candidatus Acetothermia bacterium]
MIGYDLISRKDNPEEVMAQQQLDSAQISDLWRKARSLLNDRVLQACLPHNSKHIALGEDTVKIRVDSEFKKEYCYQKLAKLEKIVGEIFGKRYVIITELPLIEELDQVKEEPKLHTKLSVLGKEERQTEKEQKPYTKIAVLGIGDGGLNAINRMKEQGLRGVTLIALDTDHQILSISSADKKVQMGAELTAGRGTGGDLKKGELATEESRWEISSLLAGMDLVFLACGLGGGTGTSATPMIAQIAKEAGALTIGVVTQPFSFEGMIRQQRAEQGLLKLRQTADVTIAISNDRLLETAPKGLSMIQAFKLADSVLHQGVRGISDLITIPGIVNLDFADIRSVLAGAGTAMMGMGEAQGEQRGLTAAKLASSNPLLDGGTIRGAQKLIMNVTGGTDMTLDEVTQAADLIRKATISECEIIFGAVVDERLTGRLKITVIATAFQAVTEKPLRTAYKKRERISTTNLEVPTFLRRQQQEEKETKKETKKEIRGQNLKR